MRVAIDASPLLVRSAGVKNYLYYWIRALRGLLDIELFPKMRDPGALDHQAFAPARLSLLHLSHLVGVDPFVGSVDVFHATNLIRKPPAKARLTATLHDLTAWRMPELHTEGTLRAEHRFAEKIAARADGLIAVSNATKQDAVDILNLPADKITVIHSGVSEAFFNAQPAKRGRPYVLFVGSIEPRKNIGTLLDAWRRFSRDYELVIAGPSGWASRETKARLRKESTYLGYVSESELPALTAGATAFVYPSLYEGFGFPVAQAMAAGVPVITSNVSSLPEVAGEAAILVDDPRSPDELGSALDRLLGDAELQKRLAQAGRERADRCFRWEQCARSSVHFFERVLAG